MEMFKYMKPQKKERKNKIHSKYIQIVLEQIFYHIQIKILSLVTCIVEIYHDMIPNLHILFSKSHIT